jgi:hypothetical protein
VAEVWLVAETCLELPPVDPIARLHYSRWTLRYVSDVSDAEWPLVEPYRPPPRRLGHPRSRPMREIDAQVEPND